MQITVITGNLGRDPEMRYTPQGTAVTTFSVGVRSNYGNKTVWWRVEAWRKLAELCNDYLKKGRQVTVIGELKTEENGKVRVWQRNDGTWEASLELTADRVEFGPGGQQPSQEQTEQEPPF